MSAFLLVLSVIATAVGVVAIGFGVPNHEFGLGSTLIISGTVSVIGGMVLLGLAAAVRQLRRIADAMTARPVPAPRRQPTADVAEPPARQAPGQRASYPPRPDPREGRAAEMRAASAPIVDAPEPPVERPRPNIMGAMRGGDMGMGVGMGRGISDTPMVAEPEAVPLAPTRPMAPAAPIVRNVPPPMAESPAEAKPTPADITSRLSNLAAAPPRQPARSEAPRVEAQRIEAQRAEAQRIEAQRVEAQRVAMPTTARAVGDSRQRANMFDTVWPADMRASRHAEAVARAPKLDVRAEPKPEPRVEPKLDIKPEPRPEPPAPRSERVEPPAAAAAREQAGPAGDRPVAILKSGVIDGMAYTLYTDGSIEAELPQGTMRFASIEELRGHLEKAERQG
jgi:hypothetical protein